jgi:PAS domain S-box-containing protein
MNMSYSVLGARILTQITAAAIDFAGRVIFWNEGAERLYGCTAAEISGQPLSSCFRAEFPNGQSEEEVLRFARLTGKWSGDCVHIFPDGRRIPVEVEVALLRDDADREIGFSIVILDVTNRKNREIERLAETNSARNEAKQQWEQLRGDGNVLERFLENLPVSAYAKDEKGRYLFNNRALSEALPFATEVVGKNDEQLFGLETARNFRANDVAVLTSNRPLQTVETLYVDGQKRSFISVKFPMTDGKGKRFVGGVSIDITESVRDREKLRCQSALLDLSSNAILMIDLDGKITYWNQGAERLYGYTASEVLGRDSYEVLKGDFSTPYEAIWDQYMREGYWEGEISVRTKQGIPITLLSQWTLLRDADGKPIAGMGISTDVTETKLAFEELRRAEAEAAARASELSAILDAMPAAAFITHDPDCRSMTSSRFAYELLRLPYGANSSKSAPIEEQPTFKAIRDGKEIPTDQLPMQLAARTGRPVNNAELTIAFEDGTTRDFFGHAVPLLDDYGQARGAVGAFIDATQRNNAERENRKNEAVLRSVLDATSDFIFMKDLDGRYLTFNRSIAETLEMPPEDIVGKTDYELFPQDVADCFKREDAETIAKGSPCVYENEVLLQGRRLCLQTVKSLCRDANGEVIGVVGISRDITGRKALETALQKRERELTEAHRIAKLGTWNSSLKSGEVKWSDEVFRAFGQDPELGQPSHAEILKMYTPESRTRLQAAHHLARTNGTPFEVDLEIRLPDGSTRWIVGRGEVDEWQDGQVVSLRGTIEDISERKQAEEELRLSKERFELVLKDSPVVVFHQDLQLRYTWIYNPALGYKASEVLGKRDIDIFERVDDGLATEAIKAQVIRSGLSQRREVVIHWRGVDRHYDLLVDPLRDSHGQIVGVICAAIDITERQQTEAALRTSESQFRKLFDSGLIGIGFPNIFGGFSGANDELLRITGYSRQDLEEGRLRWDLMTPPEYRELDALHIAEAAERGSCTPYEKEYIRKDGTRVPIICGYALLDGSNDTYIGFVQDLSERRQAETALREREQRFRILAESLPHLVWIRNADGQYLYGNQRFKDYLGLTDETVRTVGYELIHPDDRARTAANWKHSMETGEDYTNEYRLLRQDGEYRYFLGRAVPVRDEAGRILQWIGSSTDVHDQKVAEDTLRRTEKLNTAARFAASMAHEINNPLNGVVNSLYLALQDDSLTVETRELLSTADHELQRTIHAVRQALRFHRQSTAPSSLDLTEIMEAVLMLYKPRLKQPAIVLETEYRTHQRLHGFIDEVRQVFGNLIGNSLESMKKGGKLKVRIAQGRSRVKKEARGIRITVADTGTGIPSEIRTKVFEPFVSSKGSLGNGLGLWVTQDIVRKHHGTIAFRSSSNPRRHGTVFSIFLPLTDQDHPSPNS